MNGPSDRSRPGTKRAPSGPQMAAAQLQSYGEPEVLEVRTVARPEPGPGELLVAVAASAVNPHDAVVRSGTLRIITGRRFPLGVGLDFAGTVVASGAGTSDVAAPGNGTSVWGMVSPKVGHRTGAAAEYVVVPAGRVALKPAGLSMLQAASLITTGTTALRALRDVAELHTGQRLLIRGGAGGVGMVAVQIGRALGAHVTALASARDRDVLTELGADAVLDRHTTTTHQLQDYDVILDTVGTDLLAHRGHLRRGGTMVTTAFGSGPAIAAIIASTVYGSRRIRTFSSYPDQHVLDDLASFVDSGALRPVIDTVYPLRQIADAHRALTHPGRRGKLVLTTTDHHTSHPADAMNEAGNVMDTIDFDSQGLTLVAELGL